MDSYTPYCRQLQSHEDAQAAAMEKLLRPASYVTPGWLLEELSSVTISGMRHLLELEALLEKQDQDVAAAIAAQQEKDAHDH